MRKMHLFAGLFAIYATVPGLSKAEEVTLRGVGAFATNSEMDLPFQELVKWINENGKGVLQMRYIGGPESMPPLEVGNAVSSGVVDVASVPVSFYTSNLPGAAMLKLSTVPMAEQRKNGCFEKIDKMHRDGMNVKYLGRTGDGINFHLYANKKLDKADLSGLNLRVAATYQAMFSKLGANTIHMAPGDVYTALERGVVDGYGWPALGVFDLGWNEHTKYRIDPGFYIVEVNYLVNQDRWEALSDEQRQLLEKGMAHVEAQMADNPARVAKELQRQKDAGIETITFSEAETAKWLEVAKSSAIDEIRLADAEAVTQLESCLIAK